MFIPFGNSKNILNKEVVFRSGANPDLSNYKLTSLNNVHKKDLEQALERIINLNKNTIFYEISYDEKEEKIYFYTNKELRFTATPSISNFVKHQNNMSTSSLLTTIKTLKNEIPSSNTELVSLKNVAEYIINNHLHYLELKLKYERHFNIILAPIIRNNITILNYNYHNNQYI